MRVAVLLAVVLFCVAHTAVEACTTPAGRGTCMGTRACAQRHGKPYKYTDGGSGCAFLSNSDVRCCYVPATRDVHTQARASRTHVVSPITRQRTRACKIDNVRGFCTRSLQGCGDLGGQLYSLRGSTDGCAMYDGASYCCISGLRLEAAVDHVVVGTINNHARAQAGSRRHQNAAVVEEAPEEDTSGSVDLVSRPLDPKTWREPITGVWVAKEDPQTGDFFYWNTVLKKSTWDLPASVRKVYMFSVYRNVKLAQARLKEEMSRSREQTNAAAATRAARHVMSETTRQARAQSPRGKKRLAGRPKCTRGRQKGICIHEAECWDANGTAYSSRQGASGCGSYDAMTKCCVGNLRAPIAGSVGAHVENAGCSTSVIGGLAAQLAEALNCQLSDAQKLVKIDDVPYVKLSAGAAVSPYLQKSARNALKRATGAKRRTLKINSALRSLPQQLLLWTWKEACGYSKVATPGNSNHQGGAAIDVSSVSRSAYMATLKANNFKWFGAGDKPHFTYRSAVDLRSKAVLAFQRVWNQNHPSDKLRENGVWGKEVARRVMMSPADGFAKGLPGCSAMQVASLDVGAAASTAIAASEAVQLQVAAVGPLASANVLTSDGVSLVEVANLDTASEEMWQADYASVASSPEAYRTASLVQPAGSGVTRIGNLIHMPGGATDNLFTTDGGSAIMLETDETRSSIEDEAVRRLFDHVTGEQAKAKTTRSMYSGVFNEFHLPVNGHASHVMRVQGFNEEGKLVYRGFENANLGAKDLEMRAADEWNGDGVIVELRLHNDVLAKTPKGAMVRFYVLDGRQWSFVGEGALDEQGRASVRVPPHVEGMHVFKGELPDGDAATTSHYARGTPFFIVVDSELDIPTVNTARVVTANPVQLHLRAAPHVRMVTYEFVDGVSGVSKFMLENADVQSQFEIARGLREGNHEVRVTAYSGEGEVVHSAALALQVSDEVTLM